MDMKPVSTQPTSDSVSATSPVEPRPDATRRRFMVAGLAAAPLLVTLTAKPAWAQTSQGSLGNYGSATQ